MRNIWFFPASNIGSARFPCMTRMGELERLISRCGIIGINGENYSHYLWAHDKVDTPTVAQQEVL